MCRFCQKWMGVDDFFWKIVGVGYFYLKIGGSESLLSKNEWECVVFLGKWVGVGEIGWE